MINQIKNVLTKEECDTLIDYCKPRLEKSKVVNSFSSKGKSRSHKDRTSSGCILYDDNQEIQKIIEKIKHLIEEHTQLPSENQEYPYQVLNYQIGEEYKHHWDQFRTDNKYWNYAKKTGGQRKFSILIYLNNVEEGGETDYPYLDLKVKPEIGKMVIHTNMVGDECIEESYHGALPVIKGEKWVLVNWVRLNKYTG